jgi:succinoglycan biosynthesis transport protein ExoP
MEESAKPNFDYIRFARRTLRKRWWIMLGLFLLVVIPGATVVYSTSPKLYEASATLFFEEPKGEHPLLRGMAPPDESALNLAILRSRSLAKTVIDVLPRESKEELLKRSRWAVYSDRASNAWRRFMGQDVVVYSPQEQALMELQETRMSFTVMKDGTVGVTAMAFSPRVATDLANTYVDVLLARTGSQARDQARAIREMLDNLLLQTKANLTEAEDSLRKFRGSGGDGMAISDQSRLEMARLAELENGMAEVQVAKEIAGGRLAFLRGESHKGGKTEAPPRVAVRGDPIQVLRDRLSELEVKLASLNEKYTDKHPLVAATKAEVDEAQDRLRLALKSQQDPKPGGTVALGPAERAALSKQMADLEVELATLRAKEESLKQRANRARHALSLMSGRELDYARVSRTVENQRNLFGLYSERLTQARMSEQSHIRNIRVIDLASLPTSPSAKPMMKVLLVVVIAGLGLGVGLALVLEYVGEVVEIEEDVVRITGWPVLGSLPIVDAKKRRDDPLSFREVVRPNSLALEAARAVATTLELRDVQNAVHTIMITSAGAGDGKTTTLVNLGESLAEMGRRVLLLDADLRRPALHRALRVPNEIGLSDVLGPARMDLLQASRRLDDWLAVIPAGARPTNPGALLGSRQVKILLTLAREHAEVALFDSAPVMAVSDNLHLASLVDGVVLVVRSGVTLRRGLARAKARLDKANARVVGVVVNGLSPREARRHYAGYTAYVSGPTSEKRNKPRHRFWSFRRPTADSMRQRNRRSS